MHDFEAHGDTLMVSFTANTSTRGRSQRTVNSTIIVY